MKQTYDLDVAYDTSRMLTDSLTAYCHRCINQKLTEQQIEAKLLAMLRLQLAAAIEQRKETHYDKQS